MNMAKMLTEYLAEARSRPWQWGAWDCCAYPAEWVRRIAGADPMMRWRGTYSDEDGAIAHMNGAGGIVNLWTLGMIDILAPEVDEPQAGDVGVIRGLGVCGQECHAGGIYTGKRWTFLTPNGVGQCHTEHLIAWRPIRG